MNYFELFEIPVQLKVDQQSLPRKYFELSKKYHPDYFAQSSMEDQDQAQELTALLNKAFKTLRHPDETMAYVLSLKGLLQPEEKYQLAPAFLMEVMELNEQLMELELDPNPEAIRHMENRLQDLHQSSYQEVGKIIEQYQENTTTQQELLQVKEYYFRKKYLNRMLEKLGTLKKN